MMTQVLVAPYFEKWWHHWWHGGDRKTKCVCSVVTFEVLNDGGTGFGGTIL